MEGRIQELIDSQCVIDLVTELFLATDRRDWDAVRRCFAPAVHFDMTSVAGGAPARLTPEEIARGWQQGLEPIDAAHHQAGNFRVALAGDRASAFCYGIAYHYRANASGGNTRVFVGSYDVGLRREGDGWQIDSFRFDCKFVDGNRALEKS